MSARATKEELFPPALTGRLAWLWAAFCVAKIAGEVMGYLSDGGTAIWKPVLWEGSSMLVVTVLGLLQWRWLGPTGDLHANPRKWLRNCLLALPLWCIVFVSATYGLRHAVYALAGEVYTHGSWPRVFAYESLVLSMFYMLWLGVIFGLATRESLLAERIRRQESELALRAAHLALLRQQLQPHFLFNALNLVSATMYENVPRADALLRKLASLLRQASAQTAQAMHSLADELALLRDYGDIMLARFEGRVELTWCIPDNLPPCRLPSMITQPLLENAFKFGVEPYSMGSRLEVGVFLDEAGRVNLSVRQNRGRYAEGNEAKGLGLANIRRRLAVHYGDVASLTLDNLEPEGVCARITMPCEF